MNTLEELAKFGVGRRMPSDPFFAEGDDLCKPWTRLGVLEIDDEELCHNMVTKFPCDVPGCALVFDSLLQYDLHYNSSHRYYCSECKKRLPSPHILELHVLETHDSFFLAQAERKPMYACYIQQCPLKFCDAQERNDHCVSEHQFPADYRFDNFCTYKSKMKNGSKSKAKGSMMKMEVNLLDDKNEFTGKSKKKSCKKSKQQKSEKAIDSQEQEDDRSENEKVQSKQSEHKNERSDSNSEQMEECDNIEETTVQVTEKMEVNLPGNKDEFKGKCKKKKSKKSKQLESENLPDSQEQKHDRTENEKVQSIETHLKQNKDKNERCDINNSEQIKECDNSETTTLKMTKKVESTKKENSLGQDKAPFQVFTFGRGQGRGGRFTPWYKNNTYNKNNGDTSRGAQIWENADLMTALEESVMET